MHYQIKDDKDKVVYSNLESGCTQCYANYKSLGNIITCSLYNSKRRQGEKKGNRGTVFICCKKDGTSKLFKEKVENLYYSLLDVIEFRNSIESEKEKRLNRLVHNLTSLNAHNIQEIYNLVPQDLLASNVNNQIENIKKEITTDVKNAAYTFLRIAKHNLHMKNEITIYNELMKGNPTLDVKSYNIRKVMLNILHTFFVDFSQYYVRVLIGDYNHRININYDTISVAFYHLFDNCSKYVKSKSVFQIDFYEKDNHLIIRFRTKSLCIEEEEFSQIFEEGYSGINAVKIKRNGKGIGVPRIIQMLELNNAKFEIERGNDCEEYDGHKYATNKFFFIIPKDNKLSRRN